MQLQVELQLLFCDVKIGNVMVIVQTVSNAWNWKCNRVRQHGMLGGSKAPTEEEHQCG